MQKAYCYIIIALAAVQTAPVCASGLQPGEERVFTIEEIFGMAEDSETRLKISKSAAEIAAMKVQESRDALLPDMTADLSASYIGDGVLTDRNFSNAVTAPIPHFGNGFAFEATQVLYAGGALRTSVQIADIGRETAEKEVELTRQQVRMMLAGYCMDLFRMRNQRTVYMRNCELMERLVELGKSLESHGTALRNDVTRYELQLADMRVALDNVETEASVLNYRLCTMLGLDTDTVIAIDTTMLGTSLERGMEEKWMSMGEGTPAVSVASSGVEMAEARMKLVRSEMIPSVALTLSDRMDGPVLIEVPPLDNNFNYWYVGVGVRIDLGALYKTPSKMRRARAETAMSRQNLELARREADMEIQAAYARYLNSFSDLEKQVKNVELAAENYRIIRNRYENGLSIVTDMVDASNMKLSAELAEVDARISVAYSYLHLRYAAGVL